MAIDISGYGTRIDMIVLPLFPAGLEITRFPGNESPVEFPNVEVAGREMGINGDLQVWTKPAAIDVTFAVVADSDDDINLKILLNAQRAIRGKPNLRITIPSCTITYPGDKVIRLSNGIIMDGAPSNSILGEGRFAANKYKFTFEYLL